MYVWCYLCCLLGTCLLLCICVNVYIVQCFKIFVLNCRVLFSWRWMWLLQVFSTFTFNIGVSSVQTKGSLWYVILNVSFGLHVMNYLSVGNTWVAKVDGESSYLSSGFELRLDCGFCEIEWRLVDCLSVIWCSMFFWCRVAWV
jgi:hypothetical protein